MRSGEISGSGTGTLDPVDLPWLEWDPDGSPVSIHMSHVVAEQIAGAASQSASVEIGGLLLGRIENGARPGVWIERCQEIACAHSSGPEFILDSEEIAALELAASNVVAAGKFAVIGLYRSHRRAGFQLEAPDFDLMRRYFSDPSDLILLLRPSGAATASGQFFVRDEATAVRAVGTEFPLREENNEQPGPDAVHAIPDDPDTAVEAPKQKPRRLVPDFAPSPVEPPPSVLGLAGLHQPRQWTPTDELTSERGGNHLLKRWLPFVLALGVVGGVVWFFLQPALRSASSSPAAGQTPLVVRPLGLSVDAPGGPVWQVSWNPNATALHERRNVRLFVRERGDSKLQSGADDLSGDNSNPIDLSPQDLASGSYQYRPVGNDVTFRLEVTDQAGHVSAESFRLIRPQAAPAPEPGPARPERPENLRTIQPKAIYRAPAVVAAGIRSRIRGVIPIDIRVEIDAHGHVISAAPVARQHGGIDEYLATRAVQAAKKWRFEPARENGTAVEGSQILHFVFEK